MRVPKVLLICLIALAALAAAFWWLDFRISQNQSRADTIVSSYTMGSDVEDIKSAQIGRQIAIHVIGKDRLATALADELSVQLRVDPPLVEVAEVAFLQNPIEQVDRPTLLIRVVDKHTIWTPFYAWSNLSAQIVYTSDGDLSWHTQQPVVIEYYGEESVIWIRGDIELSDRMFGLFSYPAHQTHLGAMLASEVSRSFHQSLGMHH